MKLAYASQDFGESDDSWLTEAITEIIDEQYSRTVAKDTRRSMIKNAREGFWNGGHIPFGFSAVADGKRRRLAPRDDEVGTVKTIFRWYIGGSGTKAIAEQLNLIGSACRGKPWNKARVSTVLTSQAVIGNVVFRDGDEMIVVRGHPPIIEQSEFDLVARTMDARAPAKAACNAASTAIFSGMLKCGHCGGAMMTQTATGRSATYRYYNCSTHLKGAGCASRRVRVDVVDQALLDRVLSDVLTWENLRGLCSELYTLADANARAVRDQIDALGKEASELRRRLTRLYDAIETGEGGLSLAELGPRIRQIKARLDQIDRESAILEASAEPVGELTAQQMDQACNMFKEVLKDCDRPAAVREFLAQIIRKASIKDSEVELEYWPERIVAAAGGNGSYIENVWLPDPSSLRTKIIAFSLRTWGVRRDKAA